MAPLVRRFLARLRDGAARYGRGRTGSFPALATARRYADPARRRDHHRDAGRLRRLRDVQPDLVQIVPGDAGRMGHRGVPRPRRQLPQAGDSRHADAPAPRRLPPLRRLRPLPPGTGKRRMASATGRRGLRVAPFHGDDAGDRPQPAAPGTAERRDAAVQRRSGADRVRQPDLRVPVARWIVAPCRTFRRLPFRAALSSK